MARESFFNGVLIERWDDAARLVRTFNAQGAQTSTRPYTAEEITRADADALAASQATNGSTIDANLAADLVTLQAIIDDTNANINASPAARIKDIARVQRRIIRRVIGKLDGVA